MSKNKSGWDFDRKYWPKGTKVTTKPYDLLDLWTDAPEQADRFVAEAIVNYDSGGIDFDFDKQLMLRCDVWQPGGDVIHYRHPAANVLLEVIEQADGYSLEDLEYQLRLLEKFHVQVDKCVSALRRFISEHKP